MLLRHRSLKHKEPEISLRSHSGEGGGAYIHLSVPDPGTTTQEQTPGLGCPDARPYLSALAHWAP